VPAPGRSSVFASWLDTERSAAERRRESLRRQESLWSWARLVVFIAGVVLWWAMPGWWWSGAVVLVFGAVFYGTVLRHNRVRSTREQADRLLTVLAEARQRCGGVVVVIRGPERPGPIDATERLPRLLDDGPVAPLSDQERDDLDVFARPVGLFGLLNRASSVYGAARLAECLDRPCLDAGRIRTRQAAVTWLADHPAERCELLAACARLRGEDLRLVRLVRAIQGAQPLALFTEPRILLISSAIGGALAVISGGLALRGAWVWGWLFCAIVVVHGVQMALMRKSLAAALRPWQDVAWAASGLRCAAERAARVLPQTTELSILQRALAAVMQPGSLPRLSRRAAWAEGAGIMRQVMNLLFLCDLHAAAAILNIVVPRREALLAATAAVAELEALLSFACFAAEEPVTCFPAPTGETSLRITAGRHPLITPQQVVPNDVELTAAGRLWIVTGSNMAGKSTLLRMVGTNVLLAQCGAPVTAEAMMWRPMRLATDLRVRDNLAAGESYFLAEVRHLRRMVMPPADGVPLLGLIDEPFRGTNSQEQTAASVAVIRHLLRSANLFLLATHDRSLTELADGQAARNVHFREDLGYEGLVFDYRLRHGPAQTRNALRVLEREGFPPELVAAAQDWLDQHRNDAAAG